MEPRSEVVVTTLSLGGGAGLQAESANRVSRLRISKPTLIK